jgi:hypothetical protein
VTSHIVRGLSYALWNCGLCYNIGRWYILLETLKEFGNDNSEKIERSVKIMVFTSVVFVIYAILIILCGLSEDDRTYDQILVSVHGLIISPFLILAYLIVIKRLRKYHSNLLNKYLHIYSLEEKTQINQASKQVVVFVVYIIQFLIF